MAGRDVVCFHLKMHVTPDQFNAGLAGMRAEISSLRADLTWRMLAVGGLIVAVLRLLDWSG